MGAGNQQVRQEFAIGWLAGIIDGEGFIGFVPRRDRYAPTIQLTGTNQEGLDKLHEILSALKVGHHIAWRPPTGFGKKRYWRISITGMMRVLDLMHRVGEYLVIKRRQAELVFEWIKERAAQGLRDAPTPRQLEIIRLVKEANA